MLWRKCDLYIFIKSKYLYHVPEVFSLGSSRSTYPTCSPSFASIRSSPSHLPFPFLICMFELTSVLYCSSIFLQAAVLEAEDRIKVIPESVTFEMLLINLNSPSRAGALVPNKNWGKMKHIFCWCVQTKERLNCTVFFHLPSICTHKFV